LSGESDLCSVVDKAIDLWLDEDDDIMSYGLRTMYSLLDDVVQRRVCGAVGHVSFVR
jgi:hypothetical protein